MMVHSYKGLVYHFKAIKLISILELFYLESFVMGAWHARQHARFFFNQPYEIKKRKDWAELSLLLAVFYRSSKCLCRHSYFGWTTSVSVSPSPPCNHTRFPFRAARHRAALYPFAHFSQRLVPSRVDPYSAPVRRGRRQRRRVIFSPWVRTPRDKW